MCPSWPATREEKDTTRGRARVLQEMLAPGGPVHGWRSPEVHDALDLCLSCKGCSRDCPTGVDMATYKAEVLHQSYRRRLRPRSHYTLGRLPRWADLAARAPAAGQRGARLAARRPAGQVVGRHGPAPGGARRSPGRPSGSSGPTARCRPGDGAAGARCGWTRSPTTSPRRSRSPPPRVLEAAGYRVQVPGADTCCGLTWITTGQLDAARRILGAHGRRRWRRWPTPASRSSGVEPSCTAVLRGDALELVGGADGRAGRGAAPARWPSCSTATPGLAAAVPGRARGRRPAALPPRVGAWAGRPTRALLARAGARVTRLGGCCGLAGNWGVERGHHDVSVAIAEQQLLPAVRDLAAGRRRAGRRVLLPHPARPAGRPPRPAPRRAAGRPAALTAVRPPRRRPGGPGRPRGRAGRAPRRCAVAGRGRVEPVARRTAPGRRRTRRPISAAMRATVAPAASARRAWCCCSSAHAARTAARNAGGTNGTDDMSGRRDDDDVGAGGPQRGDGRGEIGGGRGRRARTGPGRSRRSRRRRGRGASASARRTCAASWRRRRRGRRPRAGRRRSRRRSRTAAAGGRGCPRCAGRPCRRRWSHRGRRAGAECGRVNARGAGLCRGQRPCQTGARSRRTRRALAGVLGGEHRPTTSCCGPRPRPGQRGASRDDPLRRSDGQRAVRGDPRPPGRRPRDLAPAVGRRRRSAASPGHAADRCSSRRAARRRRPASA